MMAIVRNPAWIAFTWFGMTSGISLLATPVRFTAESVSRAAALDVSRVVFLALNKAEFICLVITLILVRVSGHARDLWIPVFLVTLILFTQALWLLPELSARTDLVVSGVEPPASAIHGIYSSLELAKLLLLVFVGFRSLQLLVGRESA